MTRAYAAAGRGTLGHALVRAVAAGDRVAACAAGRRAGPAPVAEALARRHLWGHLPRGAPPAPPGPPLLALTFDLDYQADTDALDPLVDLVGRVGGRMSVVAIGRLVEADPAPYARALDAGHELVNHTLNHPDNPVLCPDREFWDLDGDAMTAEVAGAQDLFERVLGTRPAGFRSPHFKDAHRLVGVLERFPELRYASSALASRTPIPTPFLPSRTAVAGAVSHLFSAADAAANSPVMQIPLTPCPEHRWSPFCSYHAIRAPADPGRGAGMHDLAAFSALWDRMLARARPLGFASVYFDPMDVMRDAATAETFEAMLRRADADGWRLATLGEVERAWRPVLRPAHGR